MVDDLTAILLQHGGNVETSRLARLVDDVFVVLDAYKVDRCILAAESAGALTALGAAQRWCWWTACTTAIFRPNRTLS